VQVRQLMFFVLATSSVMDAMDSLAAAATAALTVPPRSSRKQALTGWTHKQQEQQQQKDAQLQPQAVNGAAAGNAPDIEAGAAAAPAGLTKQHQQQQQHDDVSQPIDDSEAAAGAPAAADQPAAAAAEPSCSSKLRMRLRSSFERHTAWVAPWLPLAQNRVQFAHLKLALTRDLPAMFSSKEGEMRTAVSVFAITVLRSRPWA
jgi:hypothetical protein